jgi:hypothetical protein
MIAASGIPVRSGAAARGLSRAIDRLERVTATTAALNADRTQSARFNAALSIVRTVVAAPPVIEETAQ